MYSIGGKLVMLFICVLNGKGFVVDWGCGIWLGLIWEVDFGWFLVGDFGWDMVCIDGVMFFGM